jgi:ferredoxin hydrogenase small subunit
LQEGQWEMTSKTVVSGMPISMPAQTISVCLKKEDIAKGDVPTGQPESGQCQTLGGGEPMAARVGRLARVARHVVAVGGCAAFGGVGAADDAGIGGRGLQFDGETPGGLLGASFVAASGLPVVNVAGCPTHPGWVLDTLALLAADALPASGLDSLQRPRFYADRLVHHGCPRNEFYEFKATAHALGQQGCLIEHLGCRGTLAHADCNIRPWHGASSCLKGGFSCIDCTAPDFAAAHRQPLTTPRLAGLPTILPSDMPKAWFVALSALSKSATPARLRHNAQSERLDIAPTPPTGKRR